MTRSPRRRAPIAPDAGSRLLRARNDRVVAGVAAGLGHRLGVDAMLVRIAFVVLGFAGGFGVVLYGLLWAVLPQEPVDAVRTRRPATTQQGIALALIVLGILLLLRGLGLWFGDAVVLPVVLAATGSAVVWSRADDHGRARWTAATPRMTPEALRAAAHAPASPARVVIGTVLVAVAVAGFLAAHDAIGALWELGLAAVAAIAGIAMLFGPWLYRLVRQLGAERRERIRQEERAEFAAHLHDSVLQTLAMIQRSGGDPQRMVSLARLQERELRTWLYPTGTDAAGSTGASRLEDAAHTIASEIEAQHTLGVELVVVGDAPSTAGTDALLAAVREACVNAAKHGGVDTVDVFVEVEAEEVTAFVRDRGAGFDPSSVRDDRHGIRRSIIERIERHGGSARVTSAPGQGTEVELSVPIGDVPAGSGPQMQARSRPAAGTSEPSGESRP